MFEHSQVFRRISTSASSHESGTQTAKWNVYSENLIVTFRYKALQHGHSCFSYFGFGSTRLDELEMMSMCA